MTRLLILSHTGDTHADAVRWAMQRRGHDVTVWYLDRTPGAEAMTLAIGAADTLHCRIEDDTRLDRRFDVVWRRRGRVRPRVDPDLPACDQVVAEREARCFLDGVLAVVAPLARWVNPSAAAARASSKSVQLLAARRAGFAIPDTIMSNDPAEIRAFFAACAGEVIVKPFYPASWQQAGQGGSTFFATTLDAALLAEDFPLRAAPAIYQRRIRRGDELRVTVMGEACFTLRIAPRQAGAAVDWKADLDERVIAADALPDWLRARCVRLVRALGLEFGCIDLIRSPEGEVTFLELNEMGAFLWQEDLAPSLPLLGAFCAFIGDPGAAEAGLMAAYRASPDYAAFKAGCDPALLSYLYQQQLPEAA